jgi:hypothetical protein
VAAFSPEVQEAREKVRKLLALASRPGTSAEGAAALGAATTLAARHGLQVVGAPNGYEVLAPAPSPAVAEPPRSTRRDHPSPQVDDYVECLRCTRRIRVPTEGSAPLYCDSACRANAQRGVSKWRKRR